MIFYAVNNARILLSGINESAKHVTAIIHPITLSAVFFSLAFSPFRIFLSTRLFDVER